MMDFIIHLDNHPEWAEEVEKLMEPVGCPAFKIPLISQFLAEKGVKPNEGVAFGYF